MQGKTRRAFMSSGPPVVIELHDEEGVEWGVSFAGPNPEEQDYVRMVDGPTAFKLTALLEAA